MANGEDATTAAGGSMRFLRSIIAGLSFSSAAALVAHFLTGVGGVTMAGCVISGAVVFTAIIHLATAEKDEQYAKVPQ